MEEYGKKQYESLIDMPINWRSLFDRSGIQYVERSSNISAGEIGVKCPWCGASDPSEHLAVDENGKGYVCRRNRSHRGKSPVRLIAALLKVPYEQAQRIVGNRMVTPAFAGSALAGVKQKLSSSEVIKKPPALLLLPEFRSMNNLRRGSTVIFWDYLRDRGYSNDEIEWLSDYYNLHFTITGDFAYRLIIPIYNEYGELVNWTGRTVSSSLSPRYRALPESEAIAPGKMLLGAHKLLTGGELLVVCEGPMDAFRVSAAGYDCGVFGTCLFGTNISPEQSVLLRELHHRFDEVVLSVDPDARMRTAGMLMRAGLKLPNLTVPKGFKDPGELSADQAREWLGF